MGENVSFILLLLLFIHSFVRSFDIFRNYMFVFFIPKFHLQFQRSTVVTRMCVYSCIHDTIKHLTPLEPLLRSRSFKALLAARIESKKRANEIKTQRYRSVWLYSCERITHIHIRTLMYIRFLFAHNNLCILLFSSFMNEKQCIMHVFECESWFVSVCMCLAVSMVFVFSYINFS